MRYFVLCASDVAGIHPHIVAEVVRDEGGIDDRDVTLASALAGARATIVTREEMMTTAEGQIAIELWDAKDDGEYDRENSALTAIEEAIAHVRPKLRLIKSPRHIGETNHPSVT